ncbi:MAG: C39 family peptidase [Gemmatimonadota bacterium]
MRTLAAGWAALAVAVAVAAVAGAAPHTPYLRHVPYFCQMDNALDPGGSCQNTSMAMVLAYYGAGITPDTITARWGTDRAKTVGGWQDTFNELAAEHGLPVRDAGISDGRISQVRRQLEAGYPVVVHGAFGSGGHLVVLLGFDGDSYYVHDPAGDWLLGHPSGRYSRYPREAVERTIANASGWIRFHELRALPGKPSVTGAALPDSVVSGETVQVEAALQVSLGDGAGHLVADLSALGGPAAAELPLEADGRRTLQVAFAAAGQGLADVWVRAPASGDSVLAGTVAVLALVDEVVFGDEVGGAWASALAEGTSLSVSGERAAAGGASLALTGKGFELVLRPERPIPMHGFARLRLAFHPGEAQVFGDSLLAVFVNGDIRAHAILHGYGAPQRIDPERREWQVVEVPMSELAHVEEPLESLHLLGRYSGTVYVDDVRLEAARPSPLAVAWAAPPPDTLVAGQAVELVARVRVTRQADAASLPQLVADLSALGGGPAVPLRPGGGGLWELRQTLRPQVANGVHLAAVRASQADGSLTHVVELAHPVTVLPATDAVLFDEALRWEPAYLYSCQVALAEEPVLAGQRSLAVTAEQFTLDLAPPEPVEPAGYRALQLSFHRGSATAPSRAAFTLFVNGDERTAVKLLGGGEPGAAVDLERDGWQTVEVPLAAFGEFEGPIRSLRLLGNLCGTFYLDEIRLVAERLGSPPVTAVSGAEPQPATFALDPCYPNPFNSAVTIAFALDRAGWAEVAVYNSLGQRVRLLLAGELVAGAHQVHWDGVDDGGQRAATGAYYARLHTAAAAATEPLLLLR